MKLFVSSLVVVSISYMAYKFIESDLDISSFIFSNIMCIITQGKIFPENNPKSVKQLRDFLSNSAPILKTSNFNKETIEFSSKGLSIIIYTQKIESDDLSLKGVLLWFHGGGFVIGNAQADDFIADAIAEETGFIVVNVDYRLAPENKFPALYNDAVEVLDWTFQNIGSYGGDRNSIILSGESAGGNLAAAAAVYHASRDHSIPLLGNILIYPVLEYGVYRKSHFEERKDAMLSLDQMIWMWSLYLTKDSIIKREVDERACPSWASDEILKKMSPTAFILAQHDILRDESTFFNKRLEDNGISTKLIQYNKTLHGFFNRLPVGKIAFNDFISIVKDLSNNKRFTN